MLKIDISLKKIIIYIAALFIVVEALYCGIIYTQYPQQEISLETLYGENNNHLKDFNLSGNTLTSKSGDPWIEIPWDAKTPVYEVFVGVNRVSSSFIWAEVYLERSDSWSSTDTFLKQGSNYFTFGHNSKSNVYAIRFDLASIEGASIGLDKVIVNPYAHMALGIIKESAILISIILSTIGLLFLGYAYAKGNHKSRNAQFLWSTFSIIQILFSAYTLRLYFTVDRVSEQAFLYILICLLEIVVGYIVQLPYSKGRILKIVGKIAAFSIINYTELQILSGAKFQLTYFYAIILNIFVISILYCLLFMLFQDHCITWILPNLLCLLLGVTNFYFKNYRGQAFEFPDIQMARTAVNVISNYKFEIVHQVVFSILGFTALSLLIVMAHPAQTKKSWQKRILLGVYNIIAVITVFTHIPRMGVWNTSEVIGDFGYLYSFLAIAKTSLEKPIPKGYDLIQVSDTLTSMKPLISSEAEPAENIIVIMDEAFSDLPSVYGIETDQDCMPYIHALQGSNVQKGEMIVSVFGGTTANTEYEFLTGNSMSFLNSGDVPYTQYINHSIPSMASYLQSKGYAAEAFHPFAPSGYKRNVVYPLLGFQDFISSDDELPHTNEVRRYISDDSDFRNIISFCENKEKGKPFFLFNVTIQNHGGYSSDISSIPVTVMPAEKDLQIPGLEEYLSLVKLSDEAFKKLTQYFSKTSEKTIILMFGDHQPGLNANDWEVIHAHDQNTGSGLEEQIKTHRVPYIMWANYDLTEDVPEVTSANYLHSSLLKNAGLTLSKYDELAYECQKQYPALSAYGFYDAEGNLHDVSELDEIPMLKNYKDAAYYSLFNKNLNWDFYS